MFNEKKLISDIQTLPPEKQIEVIDFVEWLKSKSSRQTPFHSLAGLWEKYHHDLDDKAIDSKRL